MKNIAVMLGVILLSSFLPASAPATPRNLQLHGVSESLRQAVIFSSQSILDDWKAGDTLVYKMRIKPLFFIKAYAKIQVTQATKTEFTLVQEMGYKSLKTVTEMTMDRTTGEIKKLVVNGKEQKSKLGGAADSHVTVQEEAHLKVSAGEFDCVHTVQVERSGNKTESWINPRDLPITGMLKSVSTAGPIIIEMELVSFTRGS